MIQGKELHPPLHISVVAIEKGAFGLPLTQVANNIIVYNNIIYNNIYDNILRNIQYQVVWKILSNFRINYYSRNNEFK